MTHQAEDVRQEMQKVSTLVLTARRFLALGTLFDLSALEERVRDLVLMVDGMPRDEAVALVGDITSLMSRLDCLGQELRDKLKQFHLDDGRP